MDSKRVPFDFISFMGGLGWVGAGCVCVCVRLRASVRRCMGLLVGRGGPSRCFDWKVSQLLVEKASGLGSTDNITVLIVVFDQHDQTTRTARKWMAKEKPQG